MPIHGQNDEQKTTLPKFCENTKLHESGQKSKSGVRTQENHDGPDVQNLAAVVQIIFQETPCVVQQRDVRRPKVRWEGLHRRFGPVGRHMYE